LIPGYSASATRAIEMLRYDDLAIRRVRELHPVADIGNFARRLTNVLELGERRKTNAFTGETALAHLAQDDIDIAFVDVTLPRLDGIDVLRVIHKLPPNARIVIMTDNMSISTRKKPNYPVFWI